MTNSLRAWAACLALALTATASEDLARADEQAELLFVRRIRPLLQQKCLACHGNDAARLEGGLDLRTPAGILKGGDSGAPALVAGQPDASPLYLAVTRTHDAWSAMPPKDAERLTNEQVGWLKAWIAAGASQPDEVQTQAILRANADQWSAEDGVTAATSGGQTPEWTDRKYKPESLWAYRPVSKPKVDAEWSEAIDALVLSQTLIFG